MEKIKNYIDDLFKEVPKTSKAKELKEELSLDLEEKYNDLIGEGKSETEAYNEVIAGIGDIDELIGSIPAPISQHYQNANRKKTALVVSSSVFIYILSIIIIAIFEETGMPEYLTVAAFLGLCGLATCLLIYHFMSMPKYDKIDETLVEDFKEWKVSKTKDLSIRRSIRTIILTLSVIVYLLVSFIFGAWHITWIIFLIAVLIIKIIDLCLDLKEK